MYRPTYSSPAVLFLVVFGAALASTACGKVVPAVCTSEQTDCSGTCADLSSDPNNCGTCGNACSGDEVCSLGECSANCAPGLEVCDRACTDLEYSNDNCGACGNPCEEGEGCRGGLCEPLEVVAIPRIITAWPDTTGWLRPDGTPLEMTFARIDLAGVTYHCRTGHISIIGALPFEPCDGADGTAPVHRPAPTTNMEQGRYRTEMRIIVGSWVSDIVGHEYYAHQSLDRAQECPHAFSDEAVLAAAARFLPVAPPFPATTEVRNPFVRIPFVGVTVSYGARSGTPDKWLNVRDFTVELLSLRRRFVMNPERTLLLVRRQYESRQAKAYNDTANMCRNGFYFGFSRSIQGPLKSNVDCTYFVLNSRGQSVCMVPNPQDPTQLISSVYSATGYAKLQRKANYSAKGLTARCPPIFHSGACNWYLEMPQ